jgi:hypothetical protein
MEFDMGFDIEFLPVRIFSYFMAFAVFAVNTFCGKYKWSDILILYTTQNPESKGVLCVFAALYALSMYKGL